MFSTIGYSCIVLQQTATDCGVRALYGRSYEFVKRAWKLSKSKNPRLLQESFKKLL